MITFLLFNKICAELEFVKCVNFLASHALVPIVGVRLIPGFTGRKAAFQVLGKCKLTKILHICTFPVYMKFKISLTFMK